MIKVFNAYVGTEIDVNSFSFFASVCKYLAEQLRTLCEVREYTEHGWGQVTFETDRFGGGYASFNYDMRTGAVTYAKGHPEQEDVTTLERLRDIVNTQRKRMLRVRDLRAVSEAVNSEY